MSISNNNLSNLAGRGVPGVPNVAGVSQSGAPSESEVFKKLLFQAKQRLQNPLDSGTLFNDSGTSGTTANEDPVVTALQGIDASSGEATDDAFSQVDSLNRRAFNEIYSTIQTRLNQLKQAQNAKSGGNTPAIEGRGQCRAQSIEGTKPYCGSRVGGRHFVADGIGINR
ncbi:hypothetical protein EBR96_07440 [bacterium]|nr:hypothetical protein [bacterium]